MEISSAARARLSKRMDERRIELKLRWRQVTDAAGMTYEAIRGIRNGPSQIPEFTRRSFESALQWPPGEIDRILTEDDEPATENPADPPVELTAEDVDRLRGMTLDDAIAHAQQERERAGARQAILFLKLWSTVQEEVEQSSTTVTSTPNK